MKRTEWLDAALGYARRGWHVLPLWGIENGRCACGKGDCGRNAGKHPLTDPSIGLIRGGVHNATTDIATIKRWWAKHRSANLGVAMAKSGLLALDVDDYNGDDKRLEALQNRLGKLPKTLSQRSGSGQAEHLVFKAPRLRAGQKIVGDIDGIGVKHQHYIVAAPSRHLSGGRYQWVSTVEPAELAAAYVSAVVAVDSGKSGDPKVWRETIGGDGTLSSAESKHVKALLKNNPPGSNRNHKHFAATLVFGEWGLGKADGWPLFEYWNDLNPKSKRDASDLERHFRRSAVAWANSSRARGTARRDFARSRRIVRINFSETSPPAGESWPPLASEVAARPRLQREEVKTGFPALDALHGGGLLTRSLTTIVGPPGSGKTGLAISLSQHFLHERPVLYITTEQEAEEIVARFAAPRIESPIRAILRQVVGVARVRQAVDGLPLSVVGCDELHGKENDEPLQRIHAAVEQVVRRYQRPPVVVVDYLQQLVCDDGDRIRAAVGAACRHLRRMAQACGVHVITVSSTARSNYLPKREGADDPLAYLASSKESGDIEYDSANVWFVHTDRAGGEDALARIVVAKSRWGEPGFVGARFHGVTGAWSPDDDALSELSAEARASRKDDALDERVFEAIHSALQRKERPHAIRWWRSKFGVDEQRVTKSIERLVNAKRLALMEEIYGRNNKRMVVVLASRNGSGRPIAEDVEGPGQSQEVADERA